MVPLRRQGSVNYAVKLPLGELKSFHINLLKVWLEDEEAGASCAGMELASWM